MNNSEQWNALTPDEKIEAIHDDIIALTICVMELANLVHESPSAEVSAKLREIKGRIWTLGPTQLQRKMSATTGFPPKR
jgi:hypothetical protein